MWEFAWKVVESHGLAAGIMVTAVVAIGWIWKNEREERLKERDENRSLNQEMRETSAGTTTALMAVKEVSEALKAMVGALDDRLCSVNEDLEKHAEESRQNAEKSREAAGRRLEDIEKLLLTLRTKLNS